MPHLTCPPCPPRRPNWTTTRPTHPRAAPVRMGATIPTRVMAWTRVRTLEVKGENSDDTAPLLALTNWKNWSEPSPERIIPMSLPGKLIFLKAGF